jgi:hypothetical protein
MALTGDILVKFVADFAEFTTGMDASNKKLADFGESTAASGEKLTRFVEQLKTGIKALGLEELARQALEFAESTQKMATAISTQATTVGLSTDQLQAYQQAAVDAGQSQDAITSAVSRFNVAIGHATEGNAQVISAFNQLGVKILDINGKLRPTNDIMQEVATALLKIPEGAQRAAIETTLFGKAGQDVNVVLRQLAEGTDNLVAKYKAMGLVLDQETIDKFDKLERSAAQAETRIKVFIAPFYASAKSTVLGFVADMLDDIKAAIDAMDFNKFTTFAQIVAMLANPTAAIPKLIIGGQEAKAQQAFVPPDYTKAAQDAAHYTEVLGNLQKQLDGLSKSGLTPEEQTIAAAQTVKLQADARAKLLDAQQRMANAYANRNEAGAQLPPVVAGGASNPPPTGGQPGDAVARAIAELVAREKAAKDAIAQLDTITPDNVAEQLKDIDLRKRQADALSTLEKTAQKAGVTLTQTQRQQVANTVAEEDAYTRLQKTVQDAAATEAKYGDGQAAHNMIVSDLDRQLKAHLITQTAYNRAIKEQIENADQAALANTRYDDSIESLAAGFEHAANAYARSNDLYSQGEQVFNGLTTAMGEGLDGLTGKSSKTFAQIASDFAQMLAKMALQAATSAVFKMIFGSGIPGVGAPAVSVTGEAVPSYLIAGARAAGGPVDPNKTYLVGENGPERFVPQSAGTIVPMSSRDSGGSVTVNLDMSQQQGAANPTAALEFGRRIKAAVVDVIAQERRPGGTLYARRNA